MDAIRVTVRRGAVVEAVHVVHAVAVQDGAVVAEAGDGSLVCHFRSSAKPIQALPLVRARQDLTDEEIAIACASHQAEPAQLAAVRALLAKAPAEDDELECGPQEGRAPDPICHNCSGKHAGLLALCRAKSWPSEGYRLPEHPLQQLLLGEVAELADVAREEIPTATDGCGIVTFGLPLERMAFAFSRFADADGGRRIGDAMRAQPRLVGGNGADDSDLMDALAGWIAKRGAEGLMCAVSTDGLGVALKVVDGTNRAVRPALGAFLRTLERPVPSFERVAVRNSRGEAVGEITEDDAS